MIFIYSSKEIKKGMKYMAYKGIDVSSYNGTIDWNKVKAAEVAFTMLRMGYSTTIDKRFIQYYKNAKSANLVLGGYWFSYALDVSQAAQEADICIKLLKQYPLDLPIYYVFEDDSDRWAKQKNVVMNKQLRTEIIQTFCSKLQSKGYKVGIRCNENYIVNKVNWNILNKWPLWLAKWVNYGGPRPTTYVDSNMVSVRWGNPDCWQFSDNGKVNGINTNINLNYWYKELPQKQKKEELKIYQDTYTKNGLIFHKCKSFRVVYHDALKVGANYYNYINAGFFGNYKSNGGQIFTLPVANLVCDPLNIPAQGKEYVMPHLKNNKLYWDCNNNSSTQFKNKLVSTLIIPRTGKPYIADVMAPQDCVYAISGVPTLRNYKDVDYYKYVKLQGWDESCMYGTSRNWVGIRDGQIWIISGKTTSQNYIYGMEFYNKIKDEGFQDIICLDGGGSYIYKQGNTTKKTFENRRVNTLIVFT